MKSILTGLAVIISSGIISGCERRIPSPPNIQASVEINFNYDYNANAKDLEDLLIELAKQGHCQILINGVYIYLPPIGCWPESYKPNSNNVHVVNFPLSSHDNSIKDCSIELKNIGGWLQTGNIEGVNISLEENIDYETVLSLLEFLNNRDVYFSLGRTLPDRKTTLMELKKN